MPTCPYIKRGGAVCNKPYRPVGRDGTEYTTCAGHRHSAPHAVCTNCGAWTRTRYGNDGAPLCSRRECGWRAYNRAWAKEKRAKQRAAAAAAEPPSEAANPEPAARE